jgi:hypothetical protein
MEELASHNKPWDDRAGELFHKLKLIKVLDRESAREVGGSVRCLKMFHLSTSCAPQYRIE